MGYSSMLLSAGRVYMHIPCGTMALTTGRDRYLWRGMRTSFQHSEHPYVGQWGVQTSVSLAKIPSLDEDTRSTKWTSRVLGKTNIEFTDSEMKKFGTMRTSLQGEWNGVELEASKDEWIRLNEERGNSWQRWMYLLNGRSFKKSTNGYKKKFLLIYKRRTYPRWLLLQIQGTCFRCKLTAIFIQTIWLERRPRVCCLVTRPCRFRFAAVLQLFNVGLVSKFRIPTREVRGRRAPAADPGNHEVTEVLEPATSHSPLLGRSSSLTLFVEHGYRPFFVTA
ncbi:hypothetical protein PHMEG_0009119 [Phytophthora megakarya]|uniref:Uncharacterized protein n=1 Tax=Phytophthora megakarya TaxID=4795 RepID=A0A225WHJ9_9STRA|nr:hypothetical protein PHMEG_0009119 [Phytophthora megakarya]